MVGKRRYRSDRYRLIPVSAVYTRGERLHKIRDRPKMFLIIIFLAQLNVPIVRISISMMINIFFNPRFMEQPPIRLTRVPN